MQIRIEKWGCGEGGMEATVTANGREDVLALTDLLLGREANCAPPIVGAEAPSEVTLREAVEFLRQMSDEMISRGSANIGVKCVADLLEILADGKEKIRAIKLTREFSGLGLRESKELVERLLAFRQR